MNLYRSILPVQSYLKAKRAENLKIGYVPTMGALHKGHLSLIKEAQQNCDIVICTIYVNPTQFTNSSDLDLYPRPIENDIKLLVQTGCNVLFHPSTNEMYGSNLQKDNASGYGSFIEVLEGAHRPGHFDGVITIVKHFFEIIQPGEVFFGQKDYQQCLVVKTLININFKNIVFNQCPIKREPDGLAMSSRNVRLSNEERKASGLIYIALTHLKNNWNLSNWKTALSEAKTIIESNNMLKLSYFYVAHPETLVECTSYQVPAVALVAVNCGEVRLIDNMMLRIELPQNEKLKMLNE